MAKASRTVVVARPVSQSRQQELPPPDVVGFPSTSPTSPLLGDAAASSERGRWYGRAEFLYWWLGNQQAPPLATLAYANGTQSVGGGALDLGSKGQTGGRISFGSWIGDDRFFGIEADALFLARRSGAIGGNASAVGLPFVDPNGAPQSAPGGANGAYRVAGDTSLWGLELAGRLPITQNSAWRIDGLLGAKYLHLAESLQSDSFGVDGAGAARAIADSLNAANDYWLTQIGVDGAVRYGRASLGATARFGLGVDVQTANLAGTTNGAPGGFLVGAGNAGNHTRSTFAWVPEFGVRTGFDLTSRLRATAGYTVLLLPTAIRPGDLIDPVHGSGRPTFAFGESSFFAQGISGGIEFRW